MQRLIPSVKYRAVVLDKKKCPSPEDYSSLLDSISEQGFYSVQLNIEGYQCFVRPENPEELEQSKDAVRERVKLSQVPLRRYFAADYLLVFDYAEPDYTVRLREINLNTENFFGFEGENFGGLLTTATQLLGLRRRL